jgi:uncharacterized OB-fold protein
MRTKILVLAAVVGGIMASSASATTIGLWSTGICSGANTDLTQCLGGAGSMLKYGSNLGSVFDNNYQLTARADGSVNTGNNSSSTEHALSSGGPTGNYVVDGAGASEWIGPNPLAGNEAVGTYTYRTTFDLTNFDPTSLVLSLDVAADNSVQVLINGHDISALFNFNGTGSPTCGTTSAAPHAWCFEAFSSDHSITNANAGGYLPGLNTLTFVVTNTDGPGLTPTGLRVQAQGNANLLAQAAPEPVTVALVGFGLVGLGLIRRKRS